ncbi:MAG: aspartate-semialdehyde dehydrogenase [Rickettsiales bacterium]|jgi:aspartate-semialdehyde dehydrogenase|nr:aspartate-semialdehyde dehydrogenase [Rickettsiales bacterium]
MVKKIAIVGATGMAGTELLKILIQRNFPADEVIALASGKSAGKELDFGNKKLVVQDLDKYDFTETTFAFFAVGGSISDKYGKIAAKQGCIVVDKSSFYRMDKDVPLVVPEVNKSTLKDYKNKNIVASPNCSTTQMVVALKPLHDYAKIKRVVVSSYQAVSGAGKEAQEELFDNTKEYCENKNLKTPTNFKKSIVFNCIPQIDVPLENGNSAEEQKMIDETKKILGEEIEVSATCVRVPVLNAHSESVNIEFEKPITPEKARELLSKFEGVEVVDDFNNYVFATPFEYSGTDAVYVSRIRKDPSTKNALNLWIVSDNIRKGAGLNAVQIAEAMIKELNIQ